MGQTLLGGATHEGNIDLLSPQQQQFLGGILGQPGIGQQAGQAYNQFLQPFDSTKYEDVFNKAVVNPSMQQFEQRVIPSIQQSFVDANAGSSSALNQALGQSAQDLTTSLGSQYLNFFNQQQANQMGALANLGGLANQQQFSPLISQGGGILGPLLGAIGNLGAGFAMSSEKIKENIRPYGKGLAIIKNMDVKIYDYIKEMGGAKNKVGVIAEKVPNEIQAEIDGIKAVDLYGLIGLLINSVKELNEKVVHLEEQNAITHSL
jgi:hypothetical protein